MNSLFPCVRDRDARDRATRCTGRFVPYLDADTSARRHGYNGRHDRRAVLVAGHSVSRHTDTEGNRALRRQSGARARECRLRAVLGMPFYQYLGRREIAVRIVPIVEIAGDEGHAPALLPQDGRREIVVTPPAGTVQKRRGTRRRGQCKEHYSA